ncbi:MAG: LysR family transcriptional regulator [Burkholderiaceae bacterium]|nr:LysR family transcriptional regulator [Burkholderiaceae bacterium]
MDLKLMRYFLAVAEERNFTRAAQRLHMAQPPLTRQIRALEEDIGTPLFTRTGKGVELTGAGEALLDEVPNLLALAQRAKEKAALAGEGQSGRLDIGIFGSGVLDVIPRILARFHGERPEVKIVLHSLTKTEQIAALRERRIGVGFNRLVPPEDDLAVEEVLRESMTVALPAHDPLAKQASVTIPDLSDHPLILYPRLPIAGLAQQVMQAFNREKSVLRVEQEVEDVLTAVALVAGGFGACVTTASTASLRLPGVVYRPLVSKHLREIELSCLYRASDESPLLAAFVAVVREFAAKASARRK